MARIMFQGHGSLRLTTDKGIVVYIDPYAGDGYEQPADMILITHQHHDHNDLMRPAKKRGCIVIDNFDAVINGEHKCFEALGIKIEATEAYNRNHKISDCVGYIVTVDGVCCYFAGDTSKTRQMASLSQRKIDYCFLPTDGIFNMNAKQATECAELIGAAHAIPIHMKPGALFSELTARQFTPKNRLIMAPGDEIYLRPSL